MTDLRCGTWGGASASAYVTLSCARDIDGASAPTHRGLKIDVKIDNTILASGLGAVGFSAEEVAEELREHVAESGEG